MKGSWLKIVISLLLTIIVVGGLAVVFRDEIGTEQPNEFESTTGNQNSSEDINSGDDPIDGIELNETKLLF